MVIERLVAPPISYLYDRIHGRIDFEPWELEIYQTKELTRLRQVSLSAIPPVFIPTGNCASRFEHSVGVSKLAKIIGNRSEFRDIATDLYFASLGHDLGSPPFSHASEYFLIKLFGKNHEQFVDEILHESEFSNKVKSNGGNIETVTKLINGKLPPFSDLLNGTMDIDNLDNTLRYGLSTGILTSITYRPESLVESYLLHDGHIYLSPGFENQIHAWETTRREVYKFVYGIQNLTTGMVFYRGLDFAYREGELTKEFFLMNDSEALNYLLTKCNDRTQRMVLNALRWNFYTCGYNWKGVEIDETAKSLLLDSDNRSKFADEISLLLKTDFENVCVFLGRNKGFKQIHLPIFGQENNSLWHKPQEKQSFLAQVYIHPKLENKRNLEIIQEYMDEKLQ